MPFVICNDMSSKGFSFIETLISMMLLMTIFYAVGIMNMTSISLLGKGKINQRATLLLLEKIEHLKLLPIEDLYAGDFIEQSGLFSVEWQIQENVPYFGTKQIRCRVRYQESVIVVESLFYRAE